MRSTTSMSVCPDVYWSLLTTSGQGRYFQESWRCRVSRSPFSLEAAPPRREVSQATPKELALARCCVHKLTDRCVAICSILLTLDPMSICGEVICVGRGLQPLANYFRGIALARNRETFQHARVHRLCQLGDRFPVK